MTYWVASGLLTHMDAVKARNEMIEEPNPEEEGQLVVGCYHTKDGQLRYGVKMVDAEGDE